MQQLLKDLLTAYKFGVKTLYYQNTRDGAEDSQDDLVPSIQDDGCESGACRFNLLPGGVTLTRPTNNSRYCRPDKQSASGSTFQTGFTSMAYTTFHRRK